MKKKNADFLDFFLKNLDNFGLKPSLVLDKKSEKNFLHLQRYFAKEGLKENKKDVKMTLFFVLVLFLLEENIFFIVNPNNMNIFLLLQISQEMVKWFYNTDLAEHLKHRNIYWVVPVRDI